MKKNYDIIIVGAGLVGTSVILGLQKAGFRIAILEHHLPDVMTPNVKDTRPISLAYGSKEVLDRWGVWSPLEKSACPIETVHVSEQGRFGRVKFSAKDYDLPALGFVVPFALLQRTLYQKAAAQDQVDFISIEKIKAIQCEEAGASVSYQSADGEKTLYADLLIAADGVRSTCRELLGIANKTEDLGEMAQIVTLELADEHRGVAFERFTKKGTMAILPLFDRKQCRLVWTMEKAQSEKISEWDDAELLLDIEDTFGERLGKITAIKRGIRFPLHTLSVEEEIRPSMVLLGNAAHTIYPLAAQGFNLGLQDAAALSRVLVRAKRDQKSMGDVDVLQRYIDARKKNQKRIVRFTNGIAKIFRWQWPLLGHCRAISLLGIDMMPFLKDDFARTLMHV